MTERTVADRLADIYTWMREPDWTEEATLEWLMDWMNRSPVAELGMVAMLMPSRDRATHSSRDGVRAMNESLRKAAAKMEVSIMEMMFGMPRKPQTALRLRDGTLETVQLDDDGKIIEPPKRCPDCGPILLCLKHMPY